MYLQPHGSPSTGRIPSSQQSQGWSGSHRGHHLPRLPASTSAGTHFESQIAEPGPRPGSSSLLRGPQFLTGQLEGLNISAGLYELQQPRLGRKYAVKDRRPLDPPPVVKLVLYRMLDTGRDGRPLFQEIQDYTDVIEMGLVCHIDLFAVPSLTTEQCIPSRSNSDPDVVAHLSNFAIRESEKCSGALAGEIFVQAVKLDYKGNQVLFFVFPDVSVRAEGIFILRYRIFDLDITSTEGTDPDRPVLAECYSGTFEIYSTKDFPGLPPSTALTKHVAKYSIRVNVREARRKRARSGQPSP